MNSATGSQRSHLQPGGVRRANLILAAIGLTCTVVVAVGVTYGIASDPGPFAFIEGVTLPAPPPPPPPPAWLGQDPWIVGAKVDEIIENVIAEKLTPVDAASSGTPLVRSFADSCRASVATAETQRFLSDHRRSDHGSRDWYFKDRYLDEMRQVLTATSWMLFLIESRLTGTGAPTTVIAEVRAAAAHLATSCAWPGWSPPSSFEEASDARVALDACGTGWKGLPERHRDQCDPWPDRRDRARATRIVEDRIDSVIDHFERVCDRQRRCRDDPRGRERVIRPYRDLRDHIERISDKELMDLSFQIEGRPLKVNDTIVALIPIDGYLFPLSLPQELALP